ncbi:MAG: hypothetical protein RIR70_1983 [Pseudomonadota bacterium]|jgi:hypothetical protein
MSFHLGRGSAAVKSQVDDRVGRFRLIENTASRQEVFDLELNAFETGCVMRWLERRWSRPTEFAGSSFTLENKSLHIQYAQPLGGAGALAPITFETWTRRVMRMADQ